MSSDPSPLAPLDRYTPRSAARVAPLAPYVEALLDAARACDFDATRVRALRPVVRLLAAEAHGASLRCEELLVAVKDGWSALPDMRGGHGRFERDQALGRLITLCVEEYYDVDSDHSP